MSYWILIAAAGFILAAAGLLFIYRKVCAGEMRMRCFMPYLVAFVSLLAYALTSALRPGGIGGVATLLMLAPALVCLALIFRNRNYRSDLM